MRNELKNIHIKEILKKNVVVIVSFLAALISSLFVPLRNPLPFIDTNTIFVLFCLMAVVAGFAHNKVFDMIAEHLVSFAGNTRKLTVCLVLTVFFLSMIITNDVALITFVPFTVMVYRQTKKDPIFVIALETIAANMGGAFTPVGNPNNLYIFTLTGMSLSELLAVTLPVSGISLILLMICCVFIKPEKVSFTVEQKTVITNGRFLAVYGVLFVLCLLAVFGVIPGIASFILVCAGTVFTEPHLFKRIDYGLLATFAFIFIFTGNIRSIPAVAENIKILIEGNELPAAVLLSQVVTNVPATVMLSEFADDLNAVLIGSLGTLISSLASLISFKIYSASENSDPKKYILCFTGLNLAFLAVLYPVSHFIILR